LVLATVAVGTAGVVVLLPELPRWLLGRSRGSVDDHRSGRENAETHSGC
jgi:hypothetical protein